MTPDLPPRVTQQSIADEIGCHRTYVTKIFRGTRQASLPQALKIFRLTGRKFGELDGKTDEQVAALAEIFTPAERAA